MNDKPTIPSFDSILASLIEAQERDRNQPVDVHTWTEKYPQYAAQIQSFFANRGKLEEVLGPRAVVNAEAPTIGVENQPDGGPRLRYFGDYELLNEIARGGMGVVFKARQVSLNRVVAVKMILSGNLAGPSDVQRFHAEAEAAANLDHPHIVPIYEVGEHEGQHYFSMKLIEGSSLSTAKNERPAGESAKVKQRWAASLVAQVARAVHHAHQRGILHRDLKPGNILIDAAGEPHVTDFGLAKKVEGGSDLTNTGAIVGTPAYMAPEQARCEKGLSTAADVYSLGAILYELLAGRPPFKAETPLDTIMQVLEKEPASPSSITKSVDRDLETIALKCLEKEPAKRYSSAEALAEELERWERGEPITARPIGKLQRAWRWTRRNKFATNLIELLLLFGLGAGALAWWALMQADAVQEQLEENQIAEGFRSLEEGDSLLGFGLLARPLLSERSSKTRAATHRERLGLLWPTLSRPTIISAIDNIDSDIAHDAIYWSKHGRYIATNKFADSSNIFDLHTGKSLNLADYKIHGRITDADAIDNKWYLYNHKSGTIDLWDNSCKLKSTKLTFRYPFSYFSDHDATIRVAGDSALVIHPDRLDNLREYMNMLTGQQMNNTDVQIYDIATNKPSTLIHDIPEPIRRVTVIGDQFLMASWHDYTASAWNATSGVRIAGPLIHSKKINKAELAANGTRLITLCGREVKIWDMSNRPTPIAIWNVLFEPMGIAISPDGRLAAIQESFRKIHIFDALNGKPAPYKIPGSFYDFRFSPDGRKMLTISTERSAQLWDLGSTYLDIHRIVTGLKPLRAEPSPNGEYIAVLTMASDNYDEKNGFRIVVYRNDGSIVHRKTILNDGKIHGTPELSVNSSGSIIAYTEIDKMMNLVLEYMDRNAPERRISTEFQAVYNLRFHNNEDTICFYSVTDHYEHYIDCKTGMRINHCPPDSNSMHPSVQNGKIWLKHGTSTVALLDTNGIPMQSARISTDGSLVTAIDHERNIHLFNMPLPDMKTGDDWRCLLELYANWHSDFRLQHPRPLNEIPFNELKAKYPADFSVTPQQARAWRKNEIAQCMKEGNLPAAFFHRDWLIAEMVLEAAKSKK